MAFCHNVQSIITDALINVFCFFGDTEKALISLSLQEAILQETQAAIWFLHVSHTLRVE